MTGIVHVAEWAGMCDLKWADMCDLKWADICALRWADIGHFSRQSLETD